MSLLKENLEILKTRFPEVYEALSKSSPSGNIRFLPARNGAPIPYERQGSREGPLHSAVAPQREGERALKIVGEAGFVLCYGLGAGYHLSRLVLDERREILLLLDGAERLLAFLSGADLRPILASPRLGLILDPEPRRIKEAIWGRYLPGLHGSFASLSLAGIQAQRRERIAEINRIAQEALAKVKSDYSVQAHFGRIWTRNCLANLGLLNPEIQASQTEAVAALDRNLTVVLVGAGPSLTENLERIERERREQPRQFLVAADTALPPLLETGIRPDLVFSIDAQAYTLLHAEHPDARKIPWMVPLTAPPSLTRTLEKPLFFAGGTPLEQLVARGIGLSSYDTSGGNVFQTALDWIGKTGFTRLILYGADYLNLNGIPYATGSYVYRWFALRSDRLSPLASSLVGFCFDGRLEESLESYDSHYPNRRLESYREGIEEYLAASGVAVESRGACALGRNTGRKLRPGAAPPRGGTLQKLKNSIELLEELVAKAGPERTTLLYPLIAFLRHHGLASEVQGASLEERASRIFLGLISLAKPGES